jgi:hypothetical protein
LKRRASLFGSLLGTLAVWPVSAEPAVTLHVDRTAPRVAVSPSLYGIFFEEINHAGEGGLYAEMSGVHPHISTAFLHAPPAAAGKLAFELR